MTAEERARKLRLAIKANEGVGWDTTGSLEIVVKAICAAEQSARARALEEAAGVADIFAAENKAAAAKAARRARVMHGNPFGYESQTDEVMAAELTGAEHEARAIATRIRALKKAWVRREMADLRESLNNIERGLKKRNVDGTGDSEPEVSDWQDLSTAPVGYDGKKFNYILFRGASAANSFSHTVVVSGYMDRERKPVHSYHYKLRITAWQPLPEGT